MTPSEMKLTSTDHPFAIENANPSRKENYHKKKRLKNVNKVQEAEVALISLCRPAVQSSRPILPTSTELIFLTFSHPDYFSFSAQLSTHFLSFCK